MSMNQLPENMGKKIVEALKRQALSEDEQFIQNINTQPQINEQPEYSQQNPLPQYQQPQQQVNVEYQVPHQTQNVLIEEPSMVQPKINISELNENLQFSTPNSQKEVFNSYSSEFPTNVAVLKKLISQLPAGVSKQVGAQIIRQTIEALGISMNSVLQEAQQVQESLNSSITECAMKMQEYKTLIMQLEASARDYQRQMTQINDLINLFVLTDKK